MDKTVRRWARVLCPTVIAIGIAVPIEQASAAAAPTNTAIPVVSGTASVGQLLTTNSGTWTGSPAPTFTYQWQRCVVSGSCSNISTATKTTYTLTGTDSGKQIRSRVIAKNSAGSKTAFSKRTAAVTGATAPVNTTAPGVSGTPIDGGSLSSTTGAWSGTAPITYTRQWLRCSSTCAAISNATAATYVIGHNDVGSKLQLRVTAKNSASSTNAT